MGCKHQYKYLYAFIYTTNLAVRSKFSSPFEIKLLAFNFLEKLGPSNHANAITFEFKGQCG